MAVASIQDRTNEFKQCIALAQKQRHNSKLGSQRQGLLNRQQQEQANGQPPKRSEFARRAAEIGRGIAGTMEKLEKLAQCTSTCFYLLAV